MRGKVLNSNSLVNAPRGGSTEHLRYRYFQHSPTAIFSATFYCNFIGFFCGLLCENMQSAVCGLFWGGAFTL